MNSHGIVFCESPLSIHLFPEFINNSLKVRKTANSLIVKHVILLACRFRLNKLQI